MTELRQNECKHLAIKNFAPELFSKLLREYIKIKNENPSEEGL